MQSIAAPLVTDEVRRPCVLACRSRWSVVLALLTGALAAVGWETAYAVWGPNLHTVAAGEAYRSGQLSAEQFKRVIAELGIRTVLNLRGDGGDADWYKLERKAVAAAGSRLENLSMAAMPAPSASSLGHLVTLLEEAPRPVLLHCNSGIDRSGFAAAVFLLLCTDASLSDAREQLSWRYGHLPYGRASCLDRVFDQYATWLAGQGLDHCPEHFRHWAQQVYREEYAVR